MNKKGLNLRDHFKSRMLERYNITVNRELYKQIKESIESGEDNSLTKFIKKDTNRVYLYQLNIEGKEILIYFDRRRREIITALPEDSRELEEIQKGEEQ
jgi:hypothetical protein